MLCVDHYMPKENVSINGAVGLNSWWWRNIVGSGWNESNILFW